MLLNLCLLICYCSTGYGLARPDGPARYTKRPTGLCLGWRSGPQAGKARPAGHDVPPRPIRQRAGPARCPGILEGEGNLGREGRLPPTGSRREGGRAALHRQREEVTRHLLDLGGRERASLGLQREGEEERKRGHDDARRKHCSRLRRERVRKREGE